MKQIWICVVLFAAAGLFVKAQDSNESAGDYDSYYDYDFLKEEGKRLDAENDKDDTNVVKDDLENDMKVAEEIEQFQEDNEDNIEGLDEVKKALDVFNDYQFEDNRSKESKSKEEQHNDTENKDAGFDGDDSSENDTEEKIEEDSGEDVKQAKANEEADKEILDYETFLDDNEYAPLPVPPVADEEIKKILEETKDILSADGKENEDFEENNAAESIKSENQPDVSEILDETKKLLEENDDSFDSDTNEINDDDVKDEEVNDNGVSKDEEAEEDTVAKAYADLNDDISKLMATFSKLSEDVSAEQANDDEIEKSNEEDWEDNNKEEDIEENAEENEDSENKEEKVVDTNDLDEDVQDYEEKYGRPFREGLVLSQRDDYYESIDDSNLSEIFAQNDKSADDEAAEEIDEIDQALDDIDEQLNSELNPDDDSESADEVLTKDVEKSEPILYLNDAILANETQTKPTLEQNAGNAPEKEVKTKMVEDLTSSELDELLDQFALVHSDELDVNSDSFDRNVAPIHMALSVDKPLIVTSPNYPNAYPTNNVVDWIFEGEGMGIELNMTDFAVNGAMGDYLLVKPGGVDESGQEGLVFSYRLNSERRYRFTDVNRMFVRFHSNLGMPFLRGFQFSVKLIAPLSEDSEAIPEPEAVLTPPSSTLTLNLGGISLEQFHLIEEEFREILANMAKEYITANDIVAGLNTTFEVTQITRKTLCNINWPGFESCASVTFGIPLVYEDDNAEPRLNGEDLATMWRTYVNRDPFALWLSRLGIKEFSVPDDSMMMTWLVIAAGVVVSMAMLAVLLWRFSCFEDYTRMSAFSDIDSLKNEKRDLDLYPTPHQTLPPLYSESEYKWPDDKYDDSTRVDMGGFANKSYARDELYEFESDEDVITSRDRKGVFSARDIRSSDV